MYFDQPKIAPMQFGRRDVSKSNHWEAIDINNYKISKPTILCFGGNRSFEPKDANFYCKTVEEMLTKSKYSQEINKNDYDIVGVSYGHYPLKEDKVEISKLEEEEIQNIERRLLQPLYLDNKGKKIDIEKAKRNFNMLTVLCHSYGAIAFDKVIQHSFATMTGKGYTFDEINDIMSQIVCVSYAPRSIISGVSSVQIVSGCDGLNIPRNAPKKMKNTYYTYFYDLFNSKNTWGNGAQIANDNTLGVYTTNMTNNEKTDDHTLSTLINAGRDEVKEQSKNAKSIFYVAQQSLALSLKNSVENFKANVFTPKPNIEKLYQKAKYILGKHQIELDREM